MSRRYQVISGDGHLEIPPEPWIRHVPDEHRDRAPRLIPLREAATGGSSRAARSSTTVRT